jgi:hypothetical protein
MAVAYVSTVVELALASARPKFRAFLKSQHGHLDLINVEESPFTSRRQPPAPADVEFKHAPCLEKGDTEVLALLFSLF